MAFCTTCGHLNETGSRHPNHIDHTFINASNRRKNRSKSYKPYLYQRLPTDKRNIRVLLLLGNSSREAEPECELLLLPFERDAPLKYQYEALSWCWGTAKPDARIIIREGETDRKPLQKPVTPDLVAALRALRHPRDGRYFWIDQICIDQNYKAEKNHQVEMMAEIYGRASKVCIWLGEGDKSSRMALQFIKKEVLQLQNFDELCESEQASEKWGALLELMQRPWFSRRWVVQEIALARKAMLYCGEDKIAWKKFAVAVELFVEVETATHRLSEVMKKDPKFYHVPGWFEYVSALGASLLVEATGKLFRDYKPNGPTESKNNDDSENESESDDAGDEADANVSSAITKPSSVSVNPSQPFRSHLGQPLLTLEYLVSSLSIFDVTTPHDAVYALLAIAKDTTPLAGNSGVHRQEFFETQKALEQFTQQKRYIVDYDMEYADICKDFVQFAIERSKDQSRALDIICRPWAPDQDSEKDSKAKSLGRDQSEGSLKRPNRTGQSGKFLKKPRTITEIRTEYLQNFRFKVMKLRKSSPLPPINDNELTLPSWIMSLSSAAYAMYSQAGVHALKMGRKNADTLVGLPPSSQSLERNYNAADTKGVDRDALRFRKRRMMKYWCMSVKGFVLDIVRTPQPSSQTGNIPKEWAEAGGWVDAPKSDPPDEFWRTLVADRGRDGRNPPVYYSRACKESFIKGGLSGGAVKTADLINNERCSVVAEFCRRVQAVIWNRRLIKTKSDKLGLTGREIREGDLVCILYGCSVPVALRCEYKSRDDVVREMEDELLDLCTRIVVAFKKESKRRRHRNMEWGLQKFWEAEMWSDWRKSDEYFDWNKTAGSFEYFEHAEVKEISEDKRQPPKVFKISCDGTILKQAENPEDEIFCIPEYLYEELWFENRPWLEREGKVAAKKNAKRDWKDYLTSEELLQEAREDLKRECLKRWLELREFKNWKAQQRRALNKIESDEEKKAHGTAVLPKKSPLRRHKKDDLRIFKLYWKYGWGWRKIFNKRKAEAEAKRQGTFREDNKIESKNIRKKDYMKRFRKRYLTLFQTDIEAMVNSFLRYSTPKFRVDMQSELRKELEKLFINSSVKRPETYQDENDRLYLIDEPLEGKSCELKEPDWEHINEYEAQLEDSSADKAFGTGISAQKTVNDQEYMVDSDDDEQISKNFAPEHEDVEDFDGKTEVSGNGARSFAGGEDPNSDQNNQENASTELDRESQDRTNARKEIRRIKLKEILRLREKWCYYRFLGECYIHGMMDGEAMAYQNEHLIAPQVFELR